MVNGFFDSIGRLRTFNKIAAIRNNHFYTAPSFDFRPFHVSRAYHALSIDARCQRDIGSDLADGPLPSS